jgi:hypothetical protein
MFDSRFPNLVRVREFHKLDPSARSRLQKRLDRVRARTDFEGVVNTASDCLFFWIGDVESGAALEWDMTTLVGPDGSISDKHRDDLWVDQVCRSLQRGRASWSDKMRMLDYAKQAEVSAEASKKSKRRSDVERLVETHRRRAKSRLGMSTKYRPSAMVDGLKKTEVVA